MDENMINDAANKLSKMLETEDGKKEISDIISSFLGGEKEGETVQKEDSSDNKDALFSPEMLSMAKKLMSGGAKKSKSLDMLHALKPFLSKERQKKLEQAETLTRFAGIFKELGGK